MLSMKQNTTVTATDRFRIIIGQGWDRTRSFARVKAGSEAGGQKGLNFTLQVRVI